MKRNIYLILALIGLFLGASTIARAQILDIVTDEFNPEQQYEHILNFNSDITVNQDSSLNAVEKITVYANNEQINHGIYRDFPTIYKDLNGNKYKVDFKVISIKNNDQYEGYRLENSSNGIRIYIGKSDVILDPGIYTYEIAYSVTKELGFFEKEDVLYWNVTGNGWAFNIDKAEATIHLPKDVPLDKISTSAYTGQMGSNAQNFYSTTTENSIYFDTTEKLRSYEGLTIAVGWPKGFVQAPTEKEKMQNMLMDNIGLIFGNISLILIILYYTIAWIIVGRDPRRGTIIAQYEAPDKLSPAPLRFNFIQGYDNKVFTSAILNMAVKGFLTIDKTTRDYKLLKTGLNKDKLSDEELLVADALFNINDNVTVSQSNYTVFEGAQMLLKKNLEKKYLYSYFVTNRKIFVIGIIMTTILLIITSMLSDFILPLVIFASFWLLCWTYGLVKIIINIIKGPKNDKRLFIQGLIFIIPLLIGELFGIKAIIIGGSYFYVCIFSTLILVNFLFYKVLRRRTRIGRALQDRIEGFKIFLSVTEEARLNFSNPPQRTPELFEKFLPYALALGVEQQWSEQFSEIFNMSPENSQNSYRPTWYVGSNSSSFASIGAFAGAMSTSFSGEISSSSHAPGSSGGSSSSHGGGSSGGGGGGGGGGGW